MRNVLDPKRHYRANDSKSLPKYFQIATVVNSPADSDAKEGSVRKAKRTLVQELMNDADFRRYNKSKFLALQQSRAKKARHAGGQAGKKKH
jgi:hypothetical protein